jgi:hypothetical protein
MAQPSARAGQPDPPAHPSHDDRRRARSGSRQPASPCSARRSRRRPTGSSSPCATAASGILPPSERTDTQVQARTGDRHRLGVGTMAKLHPGAWTDRGRSCRRELARCGQRASHRMAPIRRRSASIRPSGLSQPVLWVDPTWLVVAPARRVLGPPAVGVDQHDRAVGPGSSFGSLRASWRGRSAERRVPVVLLHRLRRRGDQAGPPPVSRWLGSRRCCGGWATPQVTAPASVPAC